MSGPKPLLGGVELGGTKCVCFIDTSPNDIREQVSVPTGGEPQTTLRSIVEQLNTWQSVHGRIVALGIASFRPVDVATRSSTYGFITSTLKPGWRFVDVAGHLARAFDVPTGFDTDVNGAAVAEGRWGAARELSDFAYLTVGTGVGVGLVVNGGLVHGFSHPELGHVRSLEWREMAGQALARCTVTASKVWRPALPLPSAPVFLPSTFPPTARFGSPSRMPWRSYYTPSYWPPPRDESFWAEASLSRGPNFWRACARYCCKA